MKWLITFIFVLAAAIAFGLYLPEDSGFVVFGRGTWSIETSLTTFIIALAVLWLAFYFFMRFFINLSRLPMYLAQRRIKKRSRKAHQVFWQGLIELLQEKWNDAEQILIKDIEHSEKPLLRYLGAAYAAVQQKSPARAADYFDHAQAGLPKNKLSLLLLQIKLLSPHQKPEFTLNIAKQAYAIAPKDKKVLAILKNLYVESKDWNGLLSLLPELRKHKVLTTDESKTLENQCSIMLAEQSLRKAGEKMEEAWVNMAKTLQNEPAVLKIYVSHLIAHHKAATAEPLLREALKNQWDKELVVLYGTLDISTIKQQIDFLEQSLKTRHEDADLLLVLGEVCLRNRSYDKASHYLENSIQIAPQAKTYQLLGEALTQKQNIVEANKSYELGLQLALKSISMDSEG